MSNTFVRIGRYVLDVAISEQHKYEAEVTDFPVESGGSISDHIRPKPFTLTIEGVVTDTPLDTNAANKPVAFANSAGGVEDTIGHIPASSSHLPAPGSVKPGVKPQEVVKFLRSEEALEYLTSIWKSGETVPVSSSLGTFNDMALEALDVPRNKDTTGCLKFTATFKQIQKVTNARLGDKRTSIRNGNSKKKKGAQAGDSDWVIKDVLWSKAQPPGSYNIYAIEWIRWYWKPSLAGGGNAPALGQLAGNPAPQGASDTRVAEANVRENHKWYHWDHPEKGVSNPAGPQPLTPTEVAAFYKDNERDRIASYLRKNPVAIDSNKITKQAEELRRAKGNNTAAEEVRQRDQALRDANKTAGDPKFTNAANFVDTEPKPRQPADVSQAPLRGTPRLR